MTSATSNALTVRCHGPAGGVALLEMVIALAVFVATAGVVFSSLRVGLATAGELRRRNEAANLAVTVMSLIEAGTLAVESEGPVGFDDPRFEDEFYAPLAEEWTWQTVVGDVPEMLDDVGVLRVEVIVRHELSAIEYRLVRWMAEPDAGESELYEPLLGRAPAAGPHGRALR